MPESPVMVSAGVVFEDSEIGFAKMAEGWESCMMVRSRFRRSLPWLQFPIPVPSGDGKEGENEKESVDKKNPHPGLGVELGGVEHDVDGL